MLDTNAFIQSLRLDFKVEAQEHLQVISEQLFNFKEEDANDLKHQISERIFREVHSLKGAARAVNFTGIEQVCMSLENIYHKVKQKQMDLNEEIVDVSFQVVNHIQVILDKILPNVDVDENIPISNLLDRLSGINKPKSLSSGIFPSLLNDNVSEVEGKPSEASKNKNEISEASLPLLEKPLAASVQNEQGAATNVPESVRVTMSKLYDIMDQTQELITFRSVLNYHQRMLEEGIGQLQAARNSCSDITRKNNHSDQKINALMHDLQNIETRLGALSKSMFELHSNTNRSYERLDYELKQLLLFPFSTLKPVLQNTVRELCKSTGKKVDIQIDNADILIDRRILEEIKDPLNHLIRNAIDHGIETSEERIKAQKKEAGSLSICLKNTADRKINIILSDDGRGIDPEKVAASALKSGLVSREKLDQMSSHEKQMLIFSSGLSTAQKITNISGRGLGMAIVTEKIELLHGEILLSSKPGQGTTWQITIPQTLVNFRGILVQVAQRAFMIPTNTVAAAIRVKQAEISTIESRPFVKYKGTMIPLFWLEVLFNLSTSHHSAKYQQLNALIIQSAAQTMAVVVDEINGEHEGIVKPLGNILKHIEMIAGITLLGNGLTVPVIQVAELMKHAMKGDNHHHNTTEIQSTKPLRILLADDSITVRNLLRNILEASDIEVQTAIDGQDAYEKLMLGSYDAVVSDVEMPRLNGFELTAKIRREEKFQHLPVILVTALETEEDKNRGMKSGANAYIAKGSFEKNQLIETIHQFV